MHNMIKWTANERELRYLPLLMTWHLWLMRNRVLFEDFNPSSNLAIHFIMDQRSKHKVKVSTKTYRNLAGLSSVFDYPVGFFDGASTNRTGGIGVHLILSNDHFFCLKMGCGFSTNTQFELLAL